MAKVLIPPLVATILVFLIVGSLARDNGQFAQVSPERRAWFNKQVVPEAARQRLGIQYKSCCDHADVFKTRFRVGESNQDQWEYLDSDQRWKVIPPDIISEEPSLDNEPILFKVGGVPVCFFKPQGGI